VQNLVELTEENLRKYDLIVLSTDHDLYKEKSQLIIDNSQLIVDTRNVFQNKKVFKA